MSGARVWSGADRTGGLIDLVFDRLREEFPSLVIERLTATHPADDDNVYWLSLGPAPRFHGFETIQVDTSQFGSPPFLLEGERDLGERTETDDCEVAVADLAEWLRRRYGAPPAAVRTKL